MLFPFLELRWGCWSKPLKDQELLMLFCAWFPDVCDSHCVKKKKVPWFICKTWVICFQTGMMTMCLNTCSQESYFLVMLLLSNDEQWCMTLQALAKILIGLYVICVHAPKVFLCMHRMFFFVSFTNSPSYLFLVVLCRSLGSASGTKKFKTLFMLYFDNHHCQQGFFATAVVPNRFWTGTPLLGSKTCWDSCKT